MPGADLAASVLIVEVQLAAVAVSYLCVPQVAPGAAVRSHLPPTSRRLPKLHYWW